MRWRCRDGVMFPVSGKGHASVSCVQRSRCTELPTVLRHRHDCMPELPRYRPGCTPSNRTEGEAMTRSDERPTSKRAPQQQGAFVAVRAPDGALLCRYNPHTQQLEIKLRNGQYQVVSLAVYHQAEPRA